MTHYTKRILTELAYLAVMTICCLAFVLIAQELEKKPKTRPKANLTTIYNFNPKTNKYENHKTSYPTSRIRN
jgi:hypothetical protein